MKSLTPLLLTSLTIFISSCKSTPEPAGKVEVCEKAIIPSTAPVIDFDEAYHNQQVASHQYKWKDLIPYTIHFDLEFSATDTYYLNITVIPDDGSYILSSLASDEYMGKFQVILDNENISLLDELTEVPPSVTIEEPFSRKDAKAITERTICSQKIKLLTTKNFEVTGLVQFTIEPKCTFEKNHFTIAQKNGILSVVPTD